MIYVVLVSNDNALGSEVVLVTEDWSKVQEATDAIDALPEDEGYWWDTASLPSMDIITMPCAACYECSKHTSGLCFDCQGDN